MTDPEQHANWILADIAEDRRQHDYAEARRQYRIANNLPREREPLDNGIEEKKP